MQILVNPNISSKFKNSISFQSKKEVQNCSNPIKENDLAFETVSTAESSNGIAQVAMQNKPVEISPELRKKSQDFAQRFEVKTEEYVIIVQKDPKFFNRKLETLDKNVTASAQRFGVEKTKFVEVALKNPQLFYLSPETLDKNITASAQRFGVEKTKFVEAALMQSALFHQSPETLDKNITASAQRFGVEKTKFVEAALRQPQLFYQSPETLDKNITASAQRFGIEKTKFVEAALKNPALFSQSPETLDKNITASAQRFGVEKTKFVEAALKQSTLFGRLPESLERKARIYSYYKELNNIPVNNLLECLNLKADKHLLAQVLGVLINQQTEKNLSVAAKTKYAQIKEFLENNPGNYDLNIHNRKMVTENILEISKVLEKELLNNVKFKFKVI